MEISQECFSNFYYHVANNIRYSDVKLVGISEWFREIDLMFLDQMYEKYGIELNNDTYDDDWIIVKIHNEKKAAVFKLKWSQKRT